VSNEEKLKKRLKNSLKNRIKSLFPTSKLPIDPVQELGCSIEAFMQHMESQFSLHMTWNNYGKHGWHIDHIQPISKVCPSDVGELRKVCHYSNLQPLWSIENIKKSNRSNYSRLPFDYLPISPPPKQPLRPYSWTGKIEDSLSAKEVARIFQVTDYTVKKWCKQQSIGAFKVSNCWRIPVTEVLFICEGGCT